MENKVKDIEVLYVLKQKDSKYYKIGITTEFKKRSRFMQLQTASPTGIEIIKIYHLENSRENEKLIHSKFSRKRINGEWFVLNEKDLDLIDSLLIGKIDYKNKWWVGYELPLLGRHNKKEPVKKDKNYLKINFDIFHKD